MTLGFLRVLKIKWPEGLYLQENLASVNFTKQTLQDCQKQVHYLKSLLACPSTDAMLLRLRIPRLDKRQTKQTDRKWK